MRRPEGLPEGIKGLASGIAHTRLRLVQRESNPSHHFPCPIQRLDRAIAAEDHEIIGVVVHPGSENLTPPAALVRVRTTLINAARGLAKSSGYRLPRSASERFAARSRPHLPAVLEASVGPLLQQGEQLSLHIQKMEADSRAWRSRDIRKPRGSNKCRPKGPSPR